MPRNSAIRVRARNNALQVLDFKFDLVQQRKHVGLKQSEVAERMGVTQSTVAEFEKQEGNPTLRTIERYASAVDAKISLSVDDDCGPDTHSTFRQIMGGFTTASVPMNDGARRNSRAGASQRWKPGVEDGRASWMTK